MEALKIVLPGEVSSIQIVRSAAHVAGQSGVTDSIKQLTWSGPNLAYSISQA